MSYFCKEHHAPSSQVCEAGAKRLIWQRITLVSQELRHPITALHAASKNLKAGACVPAGTGTISMLYAIAAAALLVCLSLRPGQAEAACGNLTVAEMNWGSAAIAAHIDKIILERGYGCSVQLVPGDTVPTFNSMNLSAVPDMAPEFWINAVRGELTKATAANRLVIGAEILADGAVEGWWVPKHLIEANPGIRTVEDALDHPELFPAPGASDRGAVHGCPEDWSCHVTTANLFRAFEAAEKGFTLFSPRQRRSWKHPSWKPLKAKQAGWATTGRRRRFSASTRW
jgi:hypothetical protein